jgi:hypothetical protein
MADDEHGPALEAREAAYDGGIVAKRAVAMQFGKIGEEQADEIKRVGPLRMPGQLRALPGADMREEFAAQLRNLLAELGEFRRRRAVARKAL